VGFEGAEAASADVLPRPEPRAGFLATPGLKSEKGFLASGASRREKAMFLVIPGLKSGKGLLARRALGQKKILAAGTGSTISKLTEGLVHAQRMAQDLKRKPYRHGRSRHSKKGPKVAGHGGEIAVLGPIRIEGSIGEIVASRRRKQKVEGRGVTKPRTKISMKILSRNGDVAKRRRRRRRKGNSSGPPNKPAQRLFFYPSSSAFLTSLLLSA